VRDAAVGAHHDGGGADRCKQGLVPQLFPGPSFALLLTQQRRIGQRSAQFQAFHCNQGRAAPANARDEHAEALTGGLQRKGHHARDVAVRPHGAGFASGDTMGFDCPAPDTTQRIAIQRANPRGVAAMPGKINAAGLWPGRFLPCHG